MAEGRGPMFKVCLLGEVGVGKTSLFYRLKDGRFHEYVEPTKGIDSCSKVLTIDGMRVTLAVWDTAGVERFRTLTSNYYRNAHVALLVYSVDEPSSLHYLPKWLEDAVGYAPKALKVLIGNKSDLDAAMDKDAEEDFAAVYSCDLKYRISTKTGEGVEAAVKSICELLLKNMCVKDSAKTETDTFTDVDLTEEQTETRSKCRC